MMKAKTYIQHNGLWLLVAVLGIAVSGYFLLRLPFLLLAREQAQLFLWNTDYLMERLVVPGGLAQYLGEMMVQFFLNPLAGAIWYGALFVVITWLSFLLIGSPKHRYLSLLSLVPSLVLTYLWTDIRFPMTLTVAVFLALALAVGVQLLNRKAQLAVLTVLMPVGYWLIGPAIVLTLIPILYKRCNIVPAMALVIWLVACVLGSARVVPYPLKQVARGVDYYLDDTKFGTYEDMTYDMLVREQRWSAVVNRYHEQGAESLAIRDAVGLSMFQLQQIDQQEMLSHFEFSTKALSSISSAFMMSEVCMHVGMVNIAQRAAFEAMEAIPNHNKSARALHRLVETNLITGQTDVALKYIAILEQTTFYRGWASRMRVLAEQPQQLDHHPYYHRLKEIYEHGNDMFFY